jgi:hypothetical protein
LSDLVSRPYNPDPDHCCERCVFGTGQHAEWCEVRIREFLRRGRVAQEEVDQIIERAKCK